MHMALRLCYYRKKARKYTIVLGIVMDIVLFLICRNWSFLLVSIIGGLACGLIPTLTSRRKYAIAVKEMHGVKNWVGVSVIFFIMVFMIIALAYPGVEMSWE